TFDSGGSIATTGNVDILYNPLVYSAPVNYAPYVTAGTMNAYMLVNDVDQLQAMNTNISGHYALGRDRDASETAEWNGGRGFAPVGSSGARFNGSFDGRGHYISGLTIQRPGVRYIGLFGYADQAALRNVNLVNVDIGGGSYVGALLGYGGFSAASSIENVNVSGQV